MNGAATMKHVLEPTADPAWILDEKGCDPLRASSSESRFAISNGFLGVRGTREITWGARWVVPPRTYVAGLFDTPDTERPIPELVPAADWLQVGILQPDGPLAPHRGDVSSHRMTLDMRRGALLLECQLNAPGLRVGLRTFRLVSLSERAVALQLIQLEIEDGEVEVTLEATFAGVNIGLLPERLDQDLGVWRTKRSGKGLAMAAACSLRIDGHELARDRARSIQMVLELEISPRAGRVFRALGGRDAERHPRSGPGSDARDKLGVARQPRLARRGHGARGCLGEPLAV